MMVVLVLTCSNVSWNMMDDEVDILYNSSYDKRVRSSASLIIVEHNQHPVIMFGDGQLLFVEIMIMTVEMANEVS